MGGGSNYGLHILESRDKKETHVSCQCLEAIKQKLSSLSVQCFARQHINKVLNPPFNISWFLLHVCVCCCQRNQRPHSPDETSTFGVPTVAVMASDPPICAHTVGEVASIKGKMKTCGHGRLKRGIIQEELLPEVC